jgi:ubiquitin-like-conjugating enzyme ATG3
LEKGVLTPEEFVKAGDELVYRCPTWAWEGVATGMDPKKVRDYLPADKQYLITRGVPCQTRSVEQEVTLEAIDGGEYAEGDADEQWLVSEVVSQKNKTIEDEFDILDEEGEVVDMKPPAKQTEDSGNAAAQQGDEEYADMDAFEDDDVIQDVDQDIVQPDDEDNVLRVRTYDLSM